MQPVNVLSKNFMTWAEHERDDPLACIMITIVQETSSAAVLQFGLLSIGSREAKMGFRAVGILCESDTAVVVKVNVGFQ